MPQPALATKRVNAPTDTPEVPSQAHHDAQSLRWMHLVGLLRTLDVRLEHALQTVNPSSAGGSGPSVATASPDSAHTNDTCKQRLRQAVHYVKTLEQHAAQLGVLLPWRRLVEQFRLDEIERNALLLALSVELDEHYSRVYAYLQNDLSARYPDTSLLLHLFCDDAATHLEALQRLCESALFRYRLLRTTSTKAFTLASRPLQLEPAVLSWLLGRYRPMELLEDHAEMIAEPIAPESLSFVDALARTYLSSEDMLPSKGIVWAIGEDAEAALFIARWLAAQQRRCVIRVTLPRTEDASLAEEVMWHALRDAHLNDAILCVQGGERWELHFSQAQQALLSSLNEWRSVIISCDKAPDPRAPGVQIPLPAPTATQRRALWAAALGEAASQHDLDTLAERLHLNASQIAHAANRLRRAHPEDTPKVIREMSGAQKASEIARLAIPIQPRYSWQDIVLPDEPLQMLRELTETVRLRGVVLDAWGAGQKLAASRGVTALFAGPPGTGKTMAAEVIANDLGLPLYKIELSAVVSKYIGETEKNLEQVFQQGERSEVILFFDEADAIFGKRSDVKDAHDRYANLEISYLLQRMERYNGVTILATNLRANLDEAFVRRLQFAVDFPFPNEAHRLRIWETLFPSGAPRQPDLDFAMLARRYKLAGGNIRNAIMSACYLAAHRNEAVGMTHLLHGIRRELQKMGRLVEPLD